MHKHTCNWMLQVQSVLLKRYEVAPQPEPSTAEGNRPPLYVRLPQVLKDCKCRELTFHNVKVCSPPHF